MLRSDPCFVLPKSAAELISRADIAQGILALGRFEPDSLFVVKSVQVSRDRRMPAEIAPSFAALREWTRDKGAEGQWLRAADPALHVQHLLLLSRPGSAISFDNFRTLAPSVKDPGAKLGLLISHLPNVADDLRQAGVQEFAGWAVTRDSVQPVHLELEPDAFGISQLSGLWPIEQLAGNSVLLVGCGSIGAAAAEALAGYGIGRVELVDPDRFLWHNMIRHVLGPESVGRYKVDALKLRHEHRWPRQTVIPHRLDVVIDAHHIRPLMDRIDLVLCAADGIAPRRVVSHLARRAGKPAVLACVLDHGAIGEVVRLRPSPRFGCLLCLRADLQKQGAMDAEADQELDYGTGLVHQPMTAVPPDLQQVGLLAAKVAVATLLESHHGDHTQRLPGEHAIIGLRPRGDLAAPYDVMAPTEIRWRSIPPPRPTCPTCGEG